MEVSCAAPGATVRVSASITLPKAPKQYTGYYRLATAEGKKFGPRIWVDVMVVPGAEHNKEQEPEVPVQKEIKAEIVAKVEEPEIPIQIVALKQDSQDQPKVDSNKQEEPQADSTKLEEPKVDIKKIDEPKVEPKPVEPKVDPKPEEPKVDLKKPEEPKIEEPKVDLKKAEIPKIEEQQKPKVQSPYEHQLEILDGMGFQDRELNSYLLANNEGNVQRVVEWILTHMVVN